jgi:hypothetical protein
VGPPGALQCAPSPQEVIVGKLEEALSAPGKRQQLVQDCVALVDAEVESRGGISGLALKGAFKVAQAVRPGFVGDAVERFLPQFAARLDPLVAERDAGAPAEKMERYLAARADRVADALLSITDERAARATAGPLRSTYEKLRPSAKRYVADAAPRIGRLIDRHLG